jgi:hypothetical protein
VTFTSHSFPTKPNRPLWQLSIAEAGRVELPRPLRSSPFEGGAVANLLALPCGRGGSRTRTGFTLTPVAVVLARLCRPYLKYFNFIPPYFTYSRQERQTNGSQQERNLNSWSGFVSPHSVQTRLLNDLDVCIVPIAGIEPTPLGPEPSVISIRLYRQIHSITDRQVCQFLDGTAAVNSVVNGGSKPPVACNNRTAS